MPARRPQPHAPSRLAIEDARGEELRPRPADAPAEARVVATDNDGNSLTLLEEYAIRRKRRVSPVEFALSFLCAVASLAFAALLYFNSL